MANSDIFLCIHGHFYQPPRENPWMEEIELQESAVPFHDWNEKIHHECYLPNTKARVLDEKGRIMDIVNNFENINFNFGPTLVAWLESKYPETYQKILEADQFSRGTHAGHGNAIAQVYNHMILPLANRRDKETQVKWGIADFRHRFGRDPESIWLSETACNEETLEVVIEAGMKYLILEPHQAQAVRPLTGENWEDVSQGQIDPKHAYRCFLKKDPKRFIDIFFYDGPISRSLGFEDLLADARRFMDRLESAKVENYEGPQLIHLANDGETYGHHKAFGERALAYLLNVEAPKKSYHLVNYAEYLEKNPPQFEVRIKEGENGEGTSWSCAHGVGRWKDHCGCRAGGPTEWTQHWRKPLRESLDWLRDQLIKIYEEQGSPFLKDVWAARDDYVEVILDRSDSSLARFFERNAKKNLAEDEKVICFKLLEMQRHAMLMYTSCGWFFSELSGIETVQVIDYAARAIQLAGNVSGVSLEEEFLRCLAGAKSNLPEFQDGRVIYEKLVRPKIIGAEDIVAYHAITSIVSDQYEGKDRFRLYSYTLNLLHHRKESFGDITMNFGRVRILSVITQEKKDLMFLAVHIGMYDFRCSVKAFSDAAELEKTEQYFFEELQALHIVELLRRMDDVFGEKYYALKDLPVQDRKKIIAILTKEIIEKIDAVHENLYDENRRMNEIYQVINLPIPEQIRYAAEHTLEKRLNAALQELARSGFDLKKARPLLRVIEDANAFRIPLKKQQASQFLTQQLEKRTEKMLHVFQTTLVMECMNIQKVAKKMGILLDRGKAQEHLFFLSKEWTTHPDTIPPEIRESADNLLVLLADLQINPGEFKKTLHTSFFVQRESA